MNASNAFSLALIGLGLIAIDRQLVPPRVSITSRQGGCRERLSLRVRP